MRSEVVLGGRFRVFDNGSINRCFENGERPAHICTSSGYAIISDNGKKVKLHRLVAKTFIPNPEMKAEVNHIDGNKLNNAVENLEWCTHSENMKHAYRAGLTRGRTGISHRQRPNSSLLYENIEALCKERGITIARLERESGVGNATVRGWATSKPNVDTIGKVAAYLGVSIDSLLAARKEDSA